jgi:hypothetical protein
MNVERAFPVIRSAIAREKHGSTRSAASGNPGSTYILYIWDKEYLLIRRFEDIRTAERMKEHPRWWIREERLMRDLVPRRQERA